MISRILSSIAQHTGAGPFAELDDIEPCPDDFEPVPLVLRVAEFTDDDLAAMLAPTSCGCAFGGGNSAAQQLELDEIPLHDAVQKCHEIAERMRMYE
jgi:hypothetical protein